MKIFDKRCHWALWENIFQEFKCRSTYNTFYHMSWLYQLHVYCTTIIFSLQMQINNGCI